MGSTAMGNPVPHNVVVNATGIYVSILRNFAGFPEEFSIGYLCDVFGFIIVGYTDVVNTTNIPATETYCYHTLRFARCGFKV
jgi:hypothetical protein